MDKKIIISSSSDESTPFKRFKRQRFQSCPSIHDNSFYSTNRLVEEIPRKHRKSVIGEFSTVYSNYSGSLNTGEYCEVAEIGVRTLDDWRPRSNSNDSNCDKSNRTLASQVTDTLNEEFIMAKMNLDTKKALDSKTDSKLSKAKAHHYNSPFRSDLYLRVLYLVASSSWQKQKRQTSDGAQIQNQFLTEEKIRENQLKDQQNGVERMKQDLVNAGDFCPSRSSSGTVTPVEFIYQSIPKIIKRNSSSNLKTTIVSTADDKMDGTAKLSHDGFLDDHDVGAPTLVKNKSSQKLTGLEKSMLAPLTF